MPDEQKQKKARPRKAKKPTKEVTLYQLGKMLCALHEEHEEIKKMLRSLDRDIFMLKSEVECASAGHSETRDLIQQLL